MADPKLDMRPIPSALADRQRPAWAGEEEGFATALRTAALIRRGILTAREARVAGFPLTAEDEAEARRQPPCAAEIASAIRCRARLRGISEATARAELVAAGEIPGGQTQGAAA